MQYQGFFRELNSEDMRARKQRMKERKAGMPDLVVLGKKGKIGEIIIYLYEIEICEGV